jgi:outer membrane protein
LPEVIFEGQSVRKVSGWQLLGNSNEDKNTRTRTAVSTLALAASLFGFAAAASAADLPAAPYYKAPAIEAWNRWFDCARLALSPGIRVRWTGYRDQASRPRMQSFPEPDISYFFTRNIAAELILGVTRHEVTGTGVAATNNLIVGRHWLLRPTLTF